jgi:hypothetical protein
MIASAANPVSRESLPQRHREHSAAWPQPNKKTTDHTDHTDRKVMSPNERGHFHPSVRVIRVIRGFLRNNNLPEKQVGAGCHTEKTNLQRARGKPWTKGKHLKKSETQSLMAIQKR